MRRVLLALAILCIPALSHAQVIISEIMYDLAEGSDSGREWIEVYNTGLAAVSLSEWKVFENGTNHKITVLSGSAVLASGAYAVIADNAEKFRSDWPAFSGQLFDSAFSLSNDGEIVALRDGNLVERDTVRYSSEHANGTGDSLQNDGGMFMPGMPTPGASIPASGLVASAPKTVAKSRANNATTGLIAAVVGEPKERHLAAVALPAQEGSSVLWWLGPVLLAGVGAFGIVAFRRHKRTEWEIEEMV